MENRRTSHAEQRKPEGWDTLIEIIKVELNPPKQGLNLNNIREASLRDQNTVLADAWEIFKNIRECELALDNNRLARDEGVEMRGRAQLKHLKRQFQSEQALKTNFKEIRTTYHNMLLDKQRIKVSPK